MKYICSLVVVENMELSKAFYQQIMKQKIRFDFKENVLFEDGFAIHQKAHFSGLIGGKPILKESHNFELYFEFDDVEAFVKELNEQNIKFVHIVKEQPWGQKVVRFYDPDMNIIEVGESLEYLSYRLNKEGKTNAEIKVITGMPEEFIEKAIQSFKNN
jgi:catechol 2,3-dioxygenase-like lactoylglutathione lyase family enzyme